MASLAESVVVDGATRFWSRACGLRGRVVAVESSGRVKGLASIQLALTDIMQGDTSSRDHYTSILRNSSSF